MLGLATGHPRAPALERASRNVGSHDLDHLLLGQTKLGSNGFKGRAIFPSHFNDAADVGFSQVLFRGSVRLGHR